MAKRPTTKRKPRAPKKIDVPSPVWRIYAANGDFLGDSTFTHEEMAKYFPQAQYDGGAVRLV